MLDKFMQQLAKELAIEGNFSTDVIGTYLFPVDEETSIAIKEIPRGFSMSCILPESPITNEEEAYTHALHANLYSQGTKGSILGLDSEGKRLTLSRSIDYNIDYKEFKDLLEDFLNSVDLWSGEIKAFGTKLA